MRNDLTSHQEELSKQVKYFDDKMTETQKETLWKITDFEKLMATRISEQKVKDIVQQLDSRLSSDLKIIDEKINSKLNADINDLTNKVEINR